MVVAAAFSGLACGGDEGERAADPTPGEPCPEGTELVRARDVIGPTPKGYQVVPGDRKALGAIANQLEAGFGERWRGYDARVIARRNAVNGTAVIIVNVNEQTESSEEFLRGVKAAEEDNDARGEDIRVGDHDGRLQRAPDGAYLAIAPAGTCALVMLVADDEALVRDAAAKLQPQ
jgi:hypothetical protein